MDELQRDLQAGLIAKALLTDGDPGGGIPSFWGSHHG